METLGRNGSRKTKIILNLNNKHDAILLQNPFSSILELEKKPGPFSIVNYDILKKKKQ